LKNGEVRFEFLPRKSRAAAGQSKPKEPPKKIDFTGQEPLGKCPRCGGRVFEGDSAYVCEKSQAPAKPCKFKTGKVVLQQAVDRGQVSKLLAQGRTDLLPQFVSAKSGRPFQAFLVLQEGGKVGFEFPPREEKA
jgi:DNA topoisomerase-3